MDLSYIKLAKESWEHVYILYKSESNWVFQCGKDATEGCVLSKKSVGNKIFFLQVRIFCGSQTVVNN